MQFHGSVNAVQGAKNRLEYHMRVDRLGYNAEDLSVKRLSHQFQGGVGGNQDGR